MTENITTQRYCEVCGIDVNSQINHEHAKSGRLTHSIQRMDVVNAEIMR